MYHNPSWMRHQTHEVEYYENHSIGNLYNFWEPSTDSEPSNYQSTIESVCGTQCRPNLFGSWNKQLTYKIKCDTNSNGANTPAIRISTPGLPRYIPSGKKSYQHVKQHGEANQNIPRNLMNSSSRNLSANVQDKMPETWRIMSQIKASELQPD